MESGGAAAEQVLLAGSGSQSPNTDNIHRMRLKGILKSDL